MLGGKATRALPPAAIDEAIGAGQILAGRAQYGPLPVRQALAGLPRDNPAPTACMAKHDIGFAQCGQEPGAGRAGAREGRFDPPPGGAPAIGERQRVARPVDPGRVFAAAAHGAVQDGDIVLEATHRIVPRRAELASPQKRIENIDAPRPADAPGRVRADLDRVICAERHLGRVDTPTGGVLRANAFGGAAARDIHRVGRSGAMPSPGHGGQPINGRKARSIWSAVGAGGPRMS